MKNPVLVFLLFSCPFLTFAQQHEIKVGLGDLSFKYVNFNLGYEYLFANKVGIYTQVGYSKAFMSKYDSAISTKENCSAETEQLQLLQVIETVARQQTYISIQGKYYLHQMPRSNLFYLGFSLRSNFSRDKNINSETNLIVLNSLLQIIPRDSKYPDFQSIARINLRIAPVVGWKIFLLKDTLFLEPELGWQIHWLKTSDSGIFGTLNLGYRLK